MNIDALLERLDRVARTGSGYAAACPAHDDRVRSLSIGIGDEGRLLLFCHAGCSFLDVLSTLGLSFDDCFDEPRSPDAPITRRLGRIHVPAMPPYAPPAPVVRPAPVVAEKDITRWADRLQSEPVVLARIAEVKGWSPRVLRDLSIGWDGRRFTLPVRAPGGTLRGVLRYLPAGEPKMLASRGAGRDLWPRPEGFPQGSIIWLVEGEPDAISMAELGYFAVAVPGAARWLDEWTERLAGHRVIVLADCDEPGRDHARRAYHALYGQVDVCAVDLNPDRHDGYDVGDELALAARRGDLGLHRLRRGLERAAGLREAA